MRLELMTYALRKRDGDSVNSEPAGSCDDSESVVAGMVAFGASNNDCESTHTHDDLRRLFDTLPGDLAAIVLSWDKLPQDARKAVTSLVQTMASG